MPHLLRSLQTYRRDCEAHYRRGKRDARIELIAALGLLAFFVWFWMVGGAQ